MRRVNLLIGELSIRSHIYPEVMSNSNSRAANHGKTYYIVPLPVYFFVPEIGFVQHFRSRKRNHIFTNNKILKIYDMTSIHFSIMRIKKKRKCYKRIYLLIFCFYYLLLSFEVITR